MATPSTSIIKGASWLTLIIMCMSYLKLHCHWFFVFFRMFIFLFVKVLDSPDAHSKLSLTLSKHTSMQMNKHKSYFIVYLHHLCPFLFWFMCLSTFSSSWLCLIILDVYIWKYISTKTHACMATYWVNLALLMCLYILIWPLWN